MLTETTSLFLSKSSFLFRLHIVSEAEFLKYQGTLQRRSPAKVVRKEAQERGSMNDMNDSL